MTTSGIENSQWRRGVENRAGEDDPIAPPIPSTAVISVIPLAIRSRGSSSRTMLNASGKMVPPRPWIHPSDDHQRRSESRQSGQQGSDRQDRREPQPGAPASSSGGRRAGRRAGSQTQVASIKDVNTHAAPVAFVPSSQLQRRERRARQATGAARKPPPMVRSTPRRRRGRAVTRVVSGVFRVGRDPIADRVQRQPCDSTRLNQSAKVMRPPSTAARSSAQASSNGPSIS